MNQGLLLGLVGITGCARILGFQDATLDPYSLDAGRRQTDAGAATEDTQPNCETFCSTVQAACGDDGEFAVYDSEFTCLRQCRSFDLGALDDEVGNTLGCRYTHARVALQFQGERAVSCVAAGPGGNGICGANCQGYCTLMMDTCDYYPSRDECLLECGQLADTGGFTINDTAGANVQCRLYHLGAAQVSPSLHCRHAAGAYPCSSDPE